VSSGRAAGGTGARSSVSRCCRRNCNWRAGCGAAAGAKPRLRVRVRCTTRRGWINWRIQRAETRDERRQQRSHGRTGGRVQPGYREFDGLRVLQRGLQHVPQVRNHSALLTNGHGQVFASLLEVGDVHARVLARALQLCLHVRHPRLSRNDSAASNGKTQADLNDAVEAYPNTAIVCPCTSDIT